MRLLPNGGSCSCCYYLLLVVPASTCFVLESKPLWYYFLMEADMLLLLPSNVCFFSGSKIIQNYFSVCWNQQQNSWEWLYKCRHVMGPSPSFLPDIEKELGRQKHEHDATLTIGSSLLPVTIAATKVSTLWLTALCAGRPLLHMLCFSTFLWITLSLANFHNFLFLNCFSTIHWHIKHGSVFLFVIILSLSKLPICFSTIHWHIAGSHFPF